MGGSSIVKTVLDPVGTILSKTTGDDINLNPALIGKKELYDKPRKAAGDIEEQIRQQEEAAKKAEDEYKREQTEEKKRLRDLALQNLQRTQAQFKQTQGTGQKGGYSGTILTSPLGVSGNNTASSGQKTLLGY